MKLLFFGSPEIAVPFLETCAREHEVPAVVTQPDKPAGRKLELSPPAVKTAALKRGLKVLQPDNPSKLAAELAALQADMAVVVAYGKLLKPDVLSATQLGFMNVHFSLLPKHRGAAPIQWALINGEKESGVSLFWLDAGMDTGPLQRQAPLAIGPEDDALTLGRRMTELGVAELKAALADIAAGRARREPQKGPPSLAPKLTAELARLDFDRPARELHDKVRGLRAGPRAYLPLRDLRLTVLRTALEDDSEAPSSGAPGTILRVEPGKGFLVQCRSSRLWVLDVQPEGKKQLCAADFLNGRRLGPGDRLY